MKKYPINLTDKQWQVIKNMLDPKERFRKYSIRRVFEGILYLVKTGVQWRMIPVAYAPWQTLYYYFCKWKKDGVIEEVFDYIRGVRRKTNKRKPSPSVGIIDSRSVKTSHHCDGAKGIDGNKKIKGRKEHIVVDTLGIPIAVKVHPANKHDSKGASEVFEAMRYKFPDLRLIYADGGYRGEEVKIAAKQKLSCDLEVVTRSEQCSSRFKPLPKRWIVERTFSWFENFRRLTIDYEFYAESHEAMVMLASIFILLKKF